MGLKFKPGVSLLGMQPQMNCVFLSAEPIWYSQGADLVVTSVTDGAHSRGSRHYIGCAVDLRKHDLRDPEAAAKRLGEALGDQYDVVLESTHIHVEWDPERRGSR